MGIIQKDASKTMILSYFGLILGYINKGFLFILILSTEQIGLVNLIITLGLLFGQISSLGVFNSVIRFFPFFRNKDNFNHGFLKFLLIIILIGIALASLLVFSFENFVIDYYKLKSPQFIDYYYWIIPVGVSTALYLLLENYLKGLFNNVFPVFVNDILLRLILTVLILLLFFDFIDFNSFLIYSCLSYFIPVVIMVFYFIGKKEIKKLRVPISISSKFKRIIIKYGAFNYLNTIGATIVITLDSTMIASMIGLSGTGVYMTVLFLTSALQVPYRSLIRIASPIIPVYWKERQMEKMELLYKDMSGVNLVIGLFMFLTIWVNRVVLFSVLPEEYLPGIYVFLFLMIGKLFDMYSGINTTILLTSKKFAIDILFTAILLILVFSLNTVLIPDYGIVGAAISTMLAYFIYNLLRIIYIWKQFGIHPFRLNQFKVIFILVLTLIITEYTGDMILNPILSFIFGLLKICLLFLLPVYFFKLEPLINGYFQKILKQIFLKVKRG
jgi:O-antigen/teichoic acid export membrane protein